MDKFLPNFVQQ